MWEIFPTKVSQQRNISGSVPGTFLGCCAAPFIPNTPIATHKHLRVKFARRRERFVAMRKKTVFHEELREQLSLS